MRADRGGAPAWLGAMRVRILATVVVLLVLASAGAVVLLRVALIEGLDEEVSEGLQREAQEFRLISSGNDPRTGRPFAGDVRAVFDVYFSRELPDEGELLLAFVDGQLYESRRARDAARVERLPGAVEHWLSLDEPTQGTLATQEGEARYIAVPLPGAEGEPGPRGEQGVRGTPEDGLFVVANFPAFERGEIDDAMRLHVLIQLVTLVVAAALATLLAGRVLRPLTALAATARRISDTDLSRRIPVTGRDEASLIAEAFNDMLGRLERAMLAQRRFLDDTSHELRTPLTVVRGHLELLPLDETPQERQATVDLVLDEVDRISRMVDDLFLLARTDQPDFLRPAPLDLAALAHEVHRKVSTLGERRWEIDAAEPVPVLGDRHRLTQALLQLVANAVRHTVDGDLIRVDASRRDGQGVLGVQDSGAGVDPQDAGRIFDRSHRGHRPGAGPGAGTGAGLGLPIVRAIAEAHGGAARLAGTSTWTTSEDGGVARGARFEIELPLVADPGALPRRG